MMSDITKLLSTAFDNRSQILEGLKAKFTDDEIAEAVSLERKKICHGCELYSENIKDKPYEEVSHLINDFRYKMATVRKDKHCTACGCNIDLKTHSLSSVCPMKKWEALESKKDNNE